MNQDSSPASPPDHRRPLAFNLVAHRLFGGLTRQVIVDLQPRHLALDPAMHMCRLKLLWVIETARRHGGSTGLCLGRDMESGQAERVENVVAQGHLDRRVSRHTPVSRRRTGGDRRIELRYASAAQLFEAFVPVLPLPPKVAESKHFRTFPPMVLVITQVARPRAGRRELWRDSLRI